MQVFIELFDFSFLSICGWDTDLDYCDVEWAHEAIASLYQQKIINGVGDKLFAPNNLVTRAEFVTGKFGLGIRNEAGQRLIEFCQENALVIANTLFQQHKRRLYTWTSPDGQHRIRLIIYFAAKDGEALYSQQKQDRELTVAQIMNSLLPNSD